MNWGLQMRKFEQIFIKVKNSNMVEAYLLLKHFPYPKLLGKQFRDTKTFRTIQRTYGNLFNLFGGPGLGINEEVLYRLNFKFLEIPFNNQILKTTREHFLENSLPSPFVSNKVDPQRILLLKDFIIPEKSIKEQHELFEENNG